MLDGGRLDGCRLPRSLEDRKLHPPLGSDIAGRSIDKIAERRRAQVAANRALSITCKAIIQPTEVDRVAIQIRTVKEMEL